MLVLRRKCGQSIIINAKERITVKVLNEHQGVITLGVGAPKHVQVDREEVYFKKQMNDSEFNLKKHKI